MARAGVAAVEILGVYAHKPPVSTIRQYAKVLVGGTPASRLKRAHRELSRAVLVEALVHHPRKNFDFKFGQGGKGINSFGWDPRELTLDGRAIIEGETDMSKPCLRVAVWIHAYSPRKGLRTEYGRLPPRPILPMPERLARLVPYRPVD
ncbi:MAG: hypothetical protein HBSAPP03_14260 [Phycisphaerae bacterium]|nr:MAG: hypothetical protein HBSAPP03_14260 [Phycisphaerae bacterium]